MIVITSFYYVFLHVKCLSIGSVVKVQVPVCYVQDDFTYDQGRRKERDGTDRQLWPKADGHTLIQQLSTPIISVTGQIQVPMVLQDGEDGPKLPAMTLSTLSILHWHWQQAKSPNFLKQAGFVGCLLSKFCLVYLEEHLHNPTPHLLSASLLLTFKEVF